MQHTNRSITVVYCQAGMIRGRDNIILRPSQTHLHILRVSRRKFRPFSGPTQVVTERPQSRSTGTQILTPTSSVHALDFRSFYAFQVLERQQTLEQDQLDSTTSTEPSVSPPSEATLKRPPTSARRKRRYAQGSQQMPAKLSDEQQHQRRSNTRTKASPATQPKTSDQAANVEQQAERTLTRKEEKALCLAVQVCIYNCGTCYIALHYCLRLASYIDSFFGQLDPYTLMQCNAALIMQQKSDDSCSALLLRTLSSLSYIGGIPLLLIQLAKMQSTRGHHWGMYKRRLVVRTMNGCNNGRMLLGLRLLLSCKSDETGATTSACNMTLTVPVFIGLAYQLLSVAGLNCIVMQSRWYVWPS